jgi:hypothetical protein
MIREHFTVWIGGGGLEGDCVPLQTTLNCKANLFRFELYLRPGNNDNARSVEYMDTQLLNEARRIS